MKNVFPLIILSGMLVFQGCDSETGKSKIENPLAGQVEALKKAKEAERLLLDAAEKQRKTIEELTK